jgi:hypothetical protein
MLSPYVEIVELPYRLARDMSPAETGCLNQKQAI